MREPWEALGAAVRPAVERKAGSTIFGRVTEAQTLGKELLGAYRNFKQKREIKRQWTITITSEDPLYEEVSTWVYGQVKPGSRQTVTARSLGVRRDYEYDEPVAIGGRHDEEQGLRLIYDDGPQHEVHVEGHRVQVRQSGSDPQSEEEQKRRSYRQVDKLFLVTSSREAHEAVLRKLEQMIRDRKQGRRRPPVLHVAGSYGFQRRDDLPPRRMSTVVLPNGLGDELLGDLRTFLAQEQRYADRGLPWHRGLLLHGQPGTGKTSIARALAHELSLDVFYVPLGDIRGDVNLLNLLGEVRPRSMLLLEDVDAFIAARDRNTTDASEGGRLSLSGLLNALDGVATPHGIIAVLTTNDVSVLDPALLRPGRVDQVVEIGLPGKAEASRLFEVFYGRSPNAPIHVSPGMTPADLFERFKRYEDPTDAERALSGRPSLAVS